MVGGTRASSPVCAALSAVAGTVVNAAYVSSAHISFRAITFGNNGAACLVRPVLRPRQPDGRHTLTLSRSIFE